MDITAERLAVLLDGGGHGTQVEHGISYARELDKRLRKLGWKTAKSYSQCSKAVFESHLEKKGCQIVITTAWFLGIFTQIDVKGNRKSISEGSKRFILED